MQDGELGVFVLGRFFQASTQDGHAELSSCILLNYAWLNDCVAEI